MREKKVNSNYKEQKQKHFPSENIFGKPKNNAERKELIENVKQELQEKKNFKPELTIYERLKLGEELIGWASKKNWDKVKELVKKGADLTYIDSHDMNVLMYCVALGNKEILEILLEKGMTLNVEDEKGRNIVMFSTYNHDSEFLEYLYNLEKFDFNAKDKEGKTALIYAIENNNPVAISHLMKKGVEIVDGEDLIKKCIKEKKDLKIIKELLNRISLSHEYIENELSLLKYMKDEEKENILPYLDVMVEGVPNEDKDLLDYFLCIGSLYNRRKMFKRAVEKGANINSTIDHNQKTILMLVAEKGYFDLVKIIIRKNKDIVNSLDSNWNNCLAYCCTDIKNKEMVEFLLKHKVDPNRRGRYGPDNLTRTACRPDLFEISKLLIEYGASVSQSNDYHLLGEAARGNNLNLAKLLLEKNVDINETDCFGRTALIWSAWNGHVEMVKLLIESGVDINIKDDQGKTALDYAKESKNTQIEKLLKTKINI
jgi:ankyrin repeat protein